MNRVTSCLVISAVVFAFAACDKSEGTKSEDLAGRDASATLTNVQPQAPALMPVTIAESDLSTPADFEEAAQASISKTNYKAEIAILETEIAKE